MSTVKKAVGRKPGPAKSLVSGYVDSRLVMIFREKAVHDGIGISRSLEAALTLYIGSSTDDESANAALRQYGKIARVRNELARLGVSQTSIETSVERFGNEPDEFWDKYLGAYREMYKKREPVA